MKWNVFGKTYTDTHTHTQSYITGEGQNQLRSIIDFLISIKSPNWNTFQNQRGRIILKCSQLKKRKKEKKWNIFLFLRTSAIDLVRIRTHTRAITISLFHWYIYEIELNPFRRRVERKKKIPQQCPIIKVNGGKIKSRLKLISLSLSLLYSHPLFLPYLYFFLGNMIKRGGSIVPQKEMGAVRTEDI